MNGKVNGYNKFNNDDVLPREAQTDSFFAFSLFLPVSDKRKTTFCIYYSFLVLDEFNLEAKLPEFF